MGISCCATRVATTGTPAFPAGFWRPLAAELLTELLLPCNASATMAIKATRTKAPIHLFLVIRALSRPSVEPLREMVRTQPEILAQPRVLFSAGIRHLARTKQCSSEGREETVWCPSL